MPSIVKLVEGEDPEDVLLVRNNPDVCYRTKRLKEYAAYVWAARAQCQRKIICALGEQILLEEGGWISFSGSISETRQRPVGISRKLPQWRKL